MKPFIVLSTVLSLALSAAAQPPDTVWTRLYGGRGDDEGKCLQLTNDGGFILSGTCTNDQNRTTDAILIKTDSSGNVQWNYIYGESDLNDYGSCCLQTREGGYLLAGYSHAPDGWEPFDMFFAKLDSSGRRQWVTHYGDGQNYCLYCIQQTYDGGFMGVGDYAYSYSLDPFCLKTDSAGQVEWFNVLPDPTFESFNYGIQATDSNYVLVGDAWLSSPLDEQVLLVKLDQNGQMLWNRIYGKSYADWGSCLRQTPDGGFIICGCTSYTWSNQNALLIKTNSSGDICWRKSWGVLMDDHVQRLCLTVDGGFALCIIVGSGEAEIVKTDSIGNILWTKRLYRSGHSYCLYDIQQTPDDGFAAVGYTTDSPTHNDDIWLVRLAPNAIDQDRLDYHRQPLESQVTELNTSTSPNPFNLTTTFSYELHIASHVNLSVFDTAGRLITSLVEGQQQAGEYQVIFDGSQLASGVYLYCFTAGDHLTTGKMVLLK